jgi:hypothetical protein
MVMSERLTDEQLRSMVDGLRGGTETISTDGLRDIVTELLVLRASKNFLVSALKETIKRLDEKYIVGSIGHDIASVGRAALSALAKAECRS